MRLKSPRTRSAIAALVLALAADSTGAMDLKGVEMGTTKSDLDERFPNLRCTLLTRHHDAGRSSCVYEKTWLPDRQVGALNTLAEQIVDIWVFHFLNDRLVTITINFSEEAFPPISNALSDKFGKPVIKESDVQNSFGAKFRQRELLWSTKNATLAVMRYAGDRKNSALIFADKADLKRQEVERSMKSKSRAKDL